MFTPFSPSHTHALSTQVSTLLTHLLHSLTPSSHTHTHTHTQAFIHPGLARFFWSAARSDPYGLTLSPYEYCNGTFTAAQNHSFSFHQSDNLGEFVFIDFAGSGLVHLCGKMCSVMSLYNSFTTAGIVGTLQVECYMNDVIVLTVIEAHNERSTRFTQAALVCLG